MPSTPNISHVAGLFADPSRSTILISLLDGRPQTATELANHAKITPQTASAHLSKLVSSNLITKEVHGRYRYFRLTDPNVARAIESLIAISVPSEIHSLRDSNENQALRKARTCYDHLERAKTSHRGRPGGCVARPNHRTRVDRTRDFKSNDTCYGGRSAGILRTLRNPKFMRKSSVR